MHLYINRVNISLITTSREIRAAVDEITSAKNKYATTAVKTTQKSNLKNAQKHILVLSNLKHKIQVTKLSL